MSYQVAKIALWILLCVPIILICLVLVFNVRILNNDIRKEEKRREKAIRDAKLERRNSILRRRRFDEDFDRMRGRYEDEFYDVDDQGYEYHDEYDYDDTNGGYYDR